MVHHVGNDPRPCDDRLADVQPVGALIKQNPVEFEARTDFALAEIYLDLVPFADAVLPGTILKNCVHC